MSIMAYPVCTLNGRNAIELFLHRRRFSFSYLKYNNNIITQRSTILKYQYQKIIAAVINLAWYNREDM